MYREALLIYYFFIFVKEGKYLKNIVIPKRLLLNYPSKSIVNDFFLLKYKFNSADVFFIPFYDSISAAISYYK